MLAAIDMMFFNVIFLFFCNSCMSVWTNYFLFDWNQALVWTGNVFEIFCFFNARNSVHDFFNFQFRSDSLHIATANCWFNLARTGSYRFAPAIARLLSIFFPYILVREKLSRFYYAVLTRVLLGFWLVVAFELGLKQSCSIIKCWILNIVCNSTWLPVILEASSKTNYTVKITCYFLSVSSELSST